MRASIPVMLVVMISIMGTSHGADNWNINDMSSVNAYQDYTPEQEKYILMTLENDIKILDEEIKKCEKKKKGWLAATIIGSVGVVSTGVSAAVQGAQISQKKKELSAKEQELNEIKEQLNQ